MKRGSRSMRPYMTARRWGAFLGACLLTMAAVVTTSTAPAFATAYVPISGAGSTWSQNALSQWIVDVQQYGMRVNYAGVGSTQGRQEFIQGVVDFAASDIPFQTNPQDGSAPEMPLAGSYAYMPITAGGTTFMYNLIINGQRVTNLRLSGENLAKIFTGVITNWSDPALKADNPELALPNRPIIPVVRSDGSGSTAQLTAWMINQYPGLWSAYCNRTGRAPACGETSFYPAITSMVSQSGDLGVASYVAQNYADGAIGYVNYSYALNANFPVAKMLNAAGYYTEPTPDNVAVSLLKAVVDTTDVNNPALYLTENLNGVYTDPDPRTYPLSAYSYLILPTKLQGQFTTAKGGTLAAFSYYSMCQGQQEAASLGYSPMPINLVEASFAQITKIPGAVVQSINVQSCHNPTFTSNGTNLLADTAPQPQACDKQGGIQCATGTGGAKNTSTALQTSTTIGGGAASGSTGGTPSSGAAAATGSSSAATGAGGATGVTGSAAGTRESATGANGSATGAKGSASAAVTTPTVACDPSSGTCASAVMVQQASEASTGAEASGPLPTPTVLAAKHGLGTTQVLMILVGLLVALLLFVPPLVYRYLSPPER